MHRGNVFLSVVVPMYNAGEYISACIESIISQDIPTDNYEIIVVNDGSTDNGLGIVQSYSEKYSFIRIITQKNQGLSVARNTGIDNSWGDYIMFLDSDDWIKTNCFSEIKTHCIEDKLDVLRIGAANVLGTEIHKRYNLDNTLLIKGRSFFDNNTEVCAPFSICRRQLLLDHNLRFFPGIYHEDGEFTPRLYYYAERVGFLDDIIYYVRQTPNSITRSINIKKPLDLLVVMRRLHQFSISLSDAPSYFDDKISSALNQAMTQALLMPESSQNTINKAIIENKDLYYHLVKSKLLRYKIEGLLLRAFPNRPLAVFKTLRHIH